MRQRMLCVAVVITASLIVVGCSRPAPRMTEATPQSDTPPAPHTPSTGSSGALAYVGADGNIWITAPTAGLARQITTDATAPSEGQGRSYHRVAWSRDGMLLFAAVVRSGNDARGELFLQRTRHGPLQLIAENDEHFFIYLYASPALCPEQPGCPLLSYLIEEKNGVGLHLVTSQKDGVQDLRLGVGRPFYLSWSLDGQSILWHTGGTIRDNPAAEISLYDIGKDRRRILPYAPGAFLAPAWSPQGDQWLGVVASYGVDRLQQITQEETITLAAATGREISFVWSPDGQLVAYAVRRSINASSYGPIQVVELATGSSRQITNEAFGILGFFWSPDGQRLAYLSRLDLPDAIWMQWRVFDLAENRDRGFTAFHPSPLMRFVVHSFGQYAQSHRLWSPDGRYLVYADRDDQGVDRVWLVDTRAERGADPILVDEGSWGVWSWE